MRTLFEVQVERPNPLIEVPKRFVVEAVVAKMFVVVAEVVVDLVMESKICAPVKMLAV